MDQPTESPYRVPFDGSFRLDEAPTRPPKKESDLERNDKKLKKRVKQLADLQRLLYAADSYAVLLVFQAMDAAGKDGTIRGVTSGVNPAGFQVFAFKQPSAEELDHDFLWRSSRALPERGRIGIFNRSYYEETLVVRVHPEYLAAQKLPGPIDLDGLWQERFESIREHERHLARNGTVVLKFWLNVSRQEQRRRFLARIERPDKNWKFSPGDVAESRRWDEYMAAYQQMLNATSRPWAPWYAIPADEKPYARRCVADIVVQSLRALPLEFPKLGKKDRARMLELEKELRRELDESS